MKKLRITLIIIGFVIIVLTSFNFINFEKDKKVTTIKNEDTIFITDFLERKVEIERSPKRVVSLSPSITEFIFELGYEDRIVGVTKESTYSQKVKEKRKVGSYEEININLIKKLKPDIIFASKYTYQDLYNVFEKKDISVVFIEPNTYQQMFESIKKLSSIFDAEEGEKLLIRKIKNRVNKAANYSIEEAKKPNILYIQSVEPLYVAGTNTLVNDIIKLSGGQNVAHNIKGYNQYSKNKLLNNNIDIIIFCSKIKSDISIEYLKKHKLFSKLNAVKNNNILTVSNANKIYVNPTPRVSKAIDQVADKVENYLKIKDMERENERENTTGT